MQYRLSTLFLIFFFVAASFATFGVEAAWISPVVLLVAFNVSRAKKQLTLVELLVVLSIIGVLVGFLRPHYSESREGIRIKRCVENLKKISKALHRYDEQHGHLPMISTTGTDGHALFSWRVEILPQLGYEGIYNSLKTEEPWDSRHNIKLITEHENADANRSFDEFQCPSDWGRGSSYAAVVGPKTAWRDSGPVQLSGLADSGRHVIMAVEVFGDDGHWAGPEHLTVEDLMKRVDTEDETKRLGYHPFGSHVLFADGSIWRVSPEMPRALWEKLLAGNVASIDELNVGVDKSDYSAAKVIFDPTSGPDYFQFDSPAAAPSLYALPVWLVSVILLFRRAVKSRKPASTPAAA